MSRTLPTKSSSRAGRFKKKLVNAEALLIEAPLIEARMARVADLFTLERLSESEFTALYLISILSHRFPGTWLGAKRNSAPTAHKMPFSISSLMEVIDLEPNIKARLEGVADLGDLFSGFALRSTPQTVNRSLLNWSLGTYGLDLMLRIPTPHEVLHQQKRGRRCVSVLAKGEQASKFILGERDALSFTMHDLIHADHFYHDNECYQGQLGFYGLLDQCLCQGHFKELLEDEKFKWEFEYLISDMNAYAIHLMKCLKAAIIHYHPGKEEFFESWLTKLNLSAEERDALLGLYGQNYNPENQDHIILNFLKRWRVP